MDRWCECGGPAGHRPREYCDGTAVATPGGVPAKVRTLTDPTLTEQIAAILQVKPDGPMGRRIIARVQGLGF